MNVVSQSAFALLRGAEQTVRPERRGFLGLPFDRMAASEVLSALAARPSCAPFSYVVTPNVQHVVRVERRPSLRMLYNDADLSLCDSRPLHRLGRLSGQTLPLVTGSDLTVALFRFVITEGDRIAVVCSSSHLADALRIAHPNVDWLIHVPPSGAETGTAAFDDCVGFIAEAKARFTFVALGTPKSEAMCHAAKNDPHATGTALCTGAALEFMVGLKRRAPRAIQHLGFEWLHRLLSEPQRLARRYVSAFFPLVCIWLREQLKRK
ncbi:MAG: WecB/TagA/CpsF family glycosyltransferase [Pseudomonadota bacterium]